MASDAKGPGIDVMASFAEFNANLRKIHNTLGKILMLWYVSLQLIGP